MLIVRPVQRGTDLQAPAGRWNKELRVCEGHVCPRAPRPSARVRLLLRGQRACLVQMSGGSSSGSVPPHSFASAKESNKRKRRHTKYAIACDCTGLPRGPDGSSTVSSVQCLQSPWAVVAPALSLSALNSLQDTGCAAQVYWCARATSVVFTDFKRQLCGSPGAVGQCDLHVHLRRVGANDGQCLGS